MKGWETFTKDNQFAVAVFPRNPNNAPSKERAKKGQKLGDLDGNARGRLEHRS